MKLKKPSLSKKSKNFMKNTRLGKKQKFGKKLK